MSRFSLRDYQRECIAAIPEDGRFLIHMATGLGKTVTFSQIPRRGRMLILSHREELVTQPRKYFDRSFGVEMAGLRSNGEEIVSASAQSFARRIGRFRPDEFDIIVTDECHHACSPTYMKIYERFTPRLHLGFTATPNRADGAGLERIFDDIVFERDLEWGIRNGYLCDIHALRVEIGYDLQGVARRMGDYSIGELERAVNITEANRAIAEVYAKYAKGQTLIFCVSVAHAQAVAKEIPGAVAVIGGEERAGTLERFRNGEVKVIVNCMVFTEGTDLPNIETIIVARPTQSMGLYMQMIGRGTRLHPGKERLTLIDCVGNNADICEAPSLIGVDPRIVNAKAREADLFDLPGLVAREWDRPEYWVKNVEYVDMWAKKRRYRTRGVNWFRMPDGAMILSRPKFRVPPEDSLGRTIWNGRKAPTQKVFDEIFCALRDNYDDMRQFWDISNVKRWGAYQASEKQIATIRRFVPDISDRADGLTKLEANQILTRCFYRV